jgi:hypothetical protein
LADGTETGSVTANLDTYGKNTAISDILDDFLQASGLTEQDVSVDTSGVLITPVLSGGSPAVLLINKSGCEISDEEGTILINKNIVWKNGRKMTLTDANPADLSKWEIIYICT